MFQFFLHPSMRIPGSEDPQLRQRKFTCSFLTHVFLRCTMKMTDKAKYLCGNVSLTIFQIPWTWAIDKTNDNEAEPVIGGAGQHNAHSHNR